MKGYLARLNSTERRFVVAVFVVFVLVINVLFIWPRFKDWDAAEVRLAKYRRTLATYKMEIGQMKNNEAKVKALEGESAPVPPEDQGIEFMAHINSQAVQSGVTILNSGRHTEGTNQIFLEKAQSITVLAEEGQLVDFLYNLGAGNSLIRARSLSLHPDLPHQKLTAGITLVASYQKKPGVRSSVTNSGAAKSATPTKKRP